MRPAVVARLGRVGDGSLTVDRRRRGCLPRLDRAQHVHPSVVLPAWPSLQLLHQRLVAPVHPLQARLDPGAIGERVQPFSAGAQLAGSLRPTQE